MPSSDEPDQRFIAGIELFNRQEFFDCHEILEDLWKEQDEPEKQLTQGIIQIAVAYYHCLRGNRIGALKLLARGIPRVRLFLPEFRKFRLAEFIAEVEQDRTSIAAESDKLELIIPKLERNCQKRTFVS